MSQVIPDNVVAAEPIELESLQVAAKPREEPRTADDGTGTGAIEEEIKYPTGIRLWVCVASSFISAALVGLDMTIVAVAVPSLTRQFNTLDDIGWYSAAYGLVYSSFTFLFAKMYTVFSVKRLFLIAVAIFEMGSLLCTIAPTSAVFILGRAVAGLGSSGVQMGALLIITYSFPVEKRPLWNGAGGAMNLTAMVLAPLVGGALIDAWSWRACFGINLPLGIMICVLMAYSFENPANNSDCQLPLKEKIGRLDLLGTFFFIPAIVCLLIALQWGGITYGWANARIIVLLASFFILASTFAFIQYRKQDKATLPPRILMQRSVLAGAWYNACTNGVLAVTEYFLSIYFQGVRGFSAAKSGALGVPLIIGLAVTSPLIGMLTSRIGYYYPFMLAASVLSPIASGLLTTLDLDESITKVLALLGFLGVSVGMGLQGPVMAVQTVLDPKDASTGFAITGFGGGLGSSLFISVSTALFQSRLRAEVAQFAPGTNTTTTFAQGGLAGIRGLIGQARLKNVLLGYDKAVMQTLYIPVGLATLTLLGSVAMERKSVKKKQS